MKNVILIHGCCDKEEFLSDEYPTGSNSHWFPWVQKQLNKKEIESQAPEMPRAYDPQYKDWKRIMDQFTVDQDTVLVGHSCGAGFLLRWLGEEQKQIHKLIFVAPWLDPVHKRNDFLRFTIDPEIENRVKEMHVLYSAEDSVEGVPESVAIISEQFSNIHVQKIDAYGHFTFDDMETVAFPELMELI